MQLYIQFPTLISYQKEYIIQPLLFDGIRVSHEKLQDAKKNYQKEIKNRFQKIPSVENFNHQYLEEILFYSFSPEIQYRLEPIHFHSGKHYINDRIPLAIYVWKKQKYVCLPTIEYHTILIGDENTACRNDDIQQILQNLFREKRKTEEEFDPNQYLTIAKYHVGNISFSFTSEHRAVAKLEKQVSGLFSLFQKQSQFNGSEEIQKVGHTMKLQHKVAYYQTQTIQKLKKQLIEMLIGQKPISLVLIGKPGCGKTELLIECLAEIEKREQQRIEVINQKLTSIMSSKRQAMDFCNDLKTNTYFIDPLRVISGMSMVGQWENRFESILDTVSHRKRDLLKIWKNKYPPSVLKTIHDYSYDLPYLILADRILIRNGTALNTVGKSAEADLTLADLLKIRIDNQQFSIILEVSADEWIKFREKNFRLAEIFSPVFFPEANFHDTISILINNRNSLERKYNTTIDNNALHYIIGSANKFISDHQSIVGGSLEILKNIFSTSREIHLKDVQKILKKRFQFENFITDETITLIDREIEQYFNQTIVGQKRAKQVLIDTILTLKANMEEKGKPIASLLFIGPSGVGKTESAKVLAQYLFGNQEYLIRFNMNEYIDSNANQRLIGSYFYPDGQLTSMVRQKRSCILLFDEIEKANPIVYDLLLQVIGEGRLTDVMGRVTDFSRTIIIFTSNLGASKASSTIGFSQEINKDSIYRQAVEDFFRPEFLNRIDQIVPFSHIGKEEIENIIQIHFNTILSREVFIRRTIIPIWQKAIFDKLIQASYHYEMGVREIKRNIEKEIIFTASNALIGLPEEQAVLLKLKLIDHKIVPEIIPLEFSPINENALFSKKSKNIDINKEISEIIESITKRKEFLYQELDKIPAEKKGALYSTLDDMNEKFRLYEAWIEEESSTITLTSPIIKTGKRRHYYYRWPKEFSRSLYNLNVLIDEVEEVFYKKAQPYEIGESEIFRDILLEEQYEKYKFTHIQALKMEKIYLYFIAIQNYRDCSQELNQLIRQYNDLFFKYGIKADREENKNYISFTLEGYGIQQLLKSEKGFHLLKKDLQPVMPIYIDIKMDHSEELDFDNYTFLQNYQIQRLYNFSLDNKIIMVRDLQTGLILKQKIDSDTFYLLLFQNIRTEQ